MQTLDIKGLTEDYFAFNDEKAVFSLQRLIEMNKAEVEIVWEYGLNGNDEHKVIILLWEIVFRYPNKEKLFYLINRLRTSICFSWSEKLFLINQISTLIFVHPEIKDAEIENVLYSVYREVSEEFQTLFDCEKVNDIDSNLVIVTTEQFLAMEHGPTKTTLDRASVLKNNGKDVIIINTAELLGGTPPQYMLSYKTASYREDLAATNMVRYMGNEFPFIQFGRDMPNVEVASLLLNFIKSNKPKYIVNIGADSLTLDLCANLVPVLNINTVPSDIMKTRATFQVTGNRNEEYCKRKLLALGKTENDYIVGRFTSSLKEQTHQYSRSLLGLPEDKMVIAVVGGRLTNEITIEFIKMLEPVLEKGGHVAIVGIMDNYDEFCDQSNIFKNNSTNLGYQDDMLAVLECCDVYANPKRVGGGTSIIEAMHKGLPAVTLNYGDVALGAGENFIAENYEKMTEILLRHLCDLEFYVEKSQQAKERAAYMLDSTTAFNEIIAEFEQKVKIPQ